MAYRSETPQLVAMDHKDIFQLQPLRSSAYQTATYDPYDFHDHSTQHLLSSVVTGPEERRTRRVSKRLIGVHLMHGVLLGITFSFLVLSIRHWEHGVAVPIDDATRIASVVTVVCQVFFTTAVTLLYLLSGTAAVDDAIRRPHTLLDLDTRLAAWSGLGPALSNILLFFPRLSSVSLSITLGIPLYFVCGEILKVTSSSVLGMSRYLQRNAIYDSGEFGNLACSDAGLA
ncbi:hypothetical protein CYLTODRAFT_455421 [Cylindrobasidium torrendii FP15055 ss-10]|uniref:Uncharacterized protein n=1 Tax=Cylindrobasidium torrendii FP15055 ss-10 TaxID=1314674 RepID=A0A0D7B758_9AGAR|nr:hypothetical protein CYLTODRAFT_455421 [Cylindrobasidium torrendii FP15055 ss-10]